MDTQIFTSLNDGAIVCSLDRLGLIDFSGEEAQPFLQGQFTNDTKLVTENRSQLAGYCTAKGRLLATVLLWKTADGYCGQLHGDIAAAVQKRLSMYVLRAKVKVADATAQWRRFGVAGKDSAAILEKLFGVLPQQPMDTAQADGCSVIRLHGIIPRFEVVVLADTAAAVQTQLESACTPADASAWDWLDIRAGVPQIGSGTQEEFVPQMVNLDLLDAINFKKGCYTGQEIVARTHYLGKVKRRTHLAHLETTEAPSPGDRVFGVDSTEPVGMVVNVAPAPAGGFDLLAEIRLESVEAGKVRCHSAQGPELELLALPYQI